MTQPVHPRNHTHPTPGGRLHIRSVTGGTTLAFRGRLGRNDAAVLSRHLHHQLDHGVRVLVLDLSHAEVVAAETLEILRCARSRAHAENIGFHLIDRSEPSLHTSLHQQQRAGERPGRHGAAHRLLSITAGTLRQDRLARSPGVSRHGPPRERSRSDERLAHGFEWTAKIETASPERAALSFDRRSTGGFASCC